MLHIFWKHTYIKLLERKTKHNLPQARTHARTHSQSSTSKEREKKKGKKEIKLNNK